MMMVLAAISAGRVVVFVFAAVAGLSAGLAIRRALDNRRARRK